MRCSAGVRACAHSASRTLFRRKSSSTTRRPFAVRCTVTDRPSLRDCSRRISSCALSVLSTLLMLAWDTLHSMDSCSGVAGPSVRSANKARKPAQVSPAGRWTLTSKSCCTRSAARIRLKHMSIASMSALGEKADTASAACRSASAGSAGTLEAFLDVATSESRPTPDGRARRPADTCPGGRPGLPAGEAPALRGCRTAQAPIAASMGAKISRACSGVTMSAGSSS